MHSKRKPVWREDKDTEPRGDSRKSQKCLQPWQWKIKLSRCRHSQFYGNTTWGLCVSTADPAYASSQLVLLTLPPPPSWCLPIHWNAAPRATGKYGHSHGERHSEEEGVGLHQAMSIVTLVREWGKLRKEVEKQSQEIAVLTFHFWGIHGVLCMRCKLSSVFITNSAPGLFCFFCDGNHSSGVLKLGWIVCLLYGVTWGQVWSLPHENSLFLPQNRIIDHLLCIMVWPTLNSLLAKSLKFFSNKPRFFYCNPF